MIFSHEPKWQKRGYTIQTRALLLMLVGFQGHMTKMATIPIYGKNPNYFVHLLTQVSDRCPWATCFVKPYSANFSLLLFARKHIFWLNWEVKCKTIIITKACTCHENKGTKVGHQELFSRTKLKSHIYTLIKYQCASYTSWTSDG